MTVFAYRDVYSREAGNQPFGQQYTASSLSAGQYTPYFKAKGRGGKKNCLGLMMKGIYVLTAGAAQAPVAGSDALDPLLGGAGLGQLELAPATGTAGRASALTRQFVEFLYAYCTNTSFTIAALPTFASAGTATITVSWFVPVGGEGAVMRLKLPAAITAFYAANVTVAYTSLTSYIVSSNFTGRVAWREEKTASLGTSFQSIMDNLPKDIAPNVVFMQGESSATITQIAITTIDGQLLVDTVDTDTLEVGAAGIAPIAGATYTTTAGFVIACNQQTFDSFRCAFASATTHFVGFVEVTGGAEQASNESPSTTQASPAVEKVGRVTSSGDIATGSGGPSGRGAAGGMRGYPSRR